MSPRTVTVLARLDLARPVTVRHDAGLLQLLQESALRLHADRYGAASAGTALHVLACPPADWDGATTGPVRIVDLVRDRSARPTARTGGVAVVVTDDDAAAASPHRLVTVEAPAGRGQAAPCLAAVDEDPTPLSA